jgi:hypothetical protein
MRTAILALLVSSAVSAAEIPQGAHLLLRMVNSIGTRTTEEGAQVYLQTASPVAADGRILVPAGSYVQGVVVHVRRGGKVAGRAELAIRLETLTMPDGKAFKLSPRVTSVDSNGSDQKVTVGENTVKQGSDVGHDAARVAIFAGVGATIGGLAAQSVRAAGIGAGAGAAVGFAVALLTRGREVELRQGSTLDVVFDHAVSLE